MVRATTELHLQALRCDRFLPVVTGFPPGAREAGSGVEEMLGRFSPDGSPDDENVRDTSAEIHWVRGGLP